MDYYDYEPDLPHRWSEEERWVTNPSVAWKMRRRFTLRCSRCPPNRMENASRKRPCQDRYKSVRKGRCSGKTTPTYRLEENGTPTIRGSFTWDVGRTGWGRYAFPG